MPNLTQTARALADAFERKTRDNGESFYCLKDGRPEWMQNALFAAHGYGYMLPNDWCYHLARRMAEHIAESLEYDAARDLQEIVIEGAASLVPCCNGERLAWLASHLARSAYVDEVVSECGWPKDGGIFEVIGYGIESELRAIGYALADAIEAQAEADSE